MELYKSIILINCICVMVLGSINSGNCIIVNSERDVNVFVGVKLFLSRENILNEIIVIIIGMLFSRKVLYCRSKNKDISSLYCR